MTPKFHLKVEYWCQVHILLCGDLDCKVAKVVERLVPEEVWRGVRRWWEGERGGGRWGGGRKRCDEMVGG